MEEEELKQKKLEELQQAYARQKEAEQRQLDTEMQVQMLLKKAVDEKALERLNNVRLVNKELYMKAFQAIVALLQKGYVSGKVNDEQVKQILYRLKPEKEMRIIRK